VLVSFNLKNMKGFSVNAVGILLFYRFCFLSLFYIHWGPRWLLYESGDSHSDMGYSHSDLGGFCRTILRVTLSSSPTKLCVREYDRWYTWRDLYLTHWATWALSVYKISWENKICKKARFLQHCFVGLEESVTLKIVRQNPPRSEWEYPMSEWESPLSYS
jgi:hypothetical protein